MYTGASCGTWISPRKQYVAHGACSWESWMFTTSVTPAFWTFVPLAYSTTHPKDAPEPPQRGGRGPVCGQRGGRGGGVPGGVRELCHPGGAVLGKRRQGASRPPGRAQARLSLICPS
eukprot:1192574-Prorocentrum_minimum.AAC.1